MGFKVGAFAKVWKITRESNYTKVQLSTSKKSKDGLKYDTDFSGFVNLVGHAHNKAADLKEKDKIKIVNCDVTTDQNKEKKVTYTNYAIFEYEDANATTSQKTPPVSNHVTGDNEEDPDSLPFN